MQIAWVTLIVLIQGGVSRPLEASTREGPVQPPFGYELYTAETGHLYRSKDPDTYRDNIINSLFLDSTGRLWVGSVRGLAVYDGEGWRSRTFRLEVPWLLRLGLGLVTGSSSCGPSGIAEGPPGMLWFGGGFGVWRFRDGSYEEITSSSDIAGMLSLGADSRGNLWVVDRLRVFRFDGKAWSTVLSPYPGEPASVEAPGFTGLVIESNGHVWIGATAYLEFDAPWQHEGPSWIVDQERKKRDGGPPMAPLFGFDGEIWTAYGPPQGLEAFKRSARERPRGGTARGWARPELTGEGQLRVKTPNGYHVRDGDSWRRIESRDLFVGSQWILREQKKGLLSRYLALLYRQGEDVLEVQPANAQTGEVLNFRAEPMLWAHIAEDARRDCVWLGTPNGLYRIWREPPDSEGD